MWIATSNYGLIHIEGDIRNPSTLKYYNYSFYNKRMLTNNVLCLHIDKSGRLWVGTEGGGIYLYNRQNDRFEEKNQEYNIPGDMVGSIEEDKNGNLLPDGIRLNKYGRILRKTSLDEIPEIFNVIKGDMSLIGPRPLLVQYLPLYSEKQRHRHDVRPGLSGYAQVNGRNSITWTHRFELDCQYVEKITFLGDLKIIFQTVEKAFIKQEGISSATSDTMEDFNGTN